MSKLNLILLAFVAMSGMGCSTPPLATSQSSASEAMSAYDACVRAMAPYGRTRECNSVTNSQGNVPTYGQYAYYNQPVQTYDQQSSRQYYGEDLRAPYFAYVAKANPEAMAELTDKWIALAEGISVDSDELPLDAAGEDSALE